jgi:hypothetical protein
VERDFSPSVLLQAQSRESYFFQKEKEIKSLRLKDMTAHTPVRAGRNFLVQDYWAPSLAWWYCEAPACPELEAFQGEISGPEALTSAGCWKLPSD